MARITTSALIADISGKLNGSVFQRTQSGLIIRNQGGKINSNTARSNYHRSGLSSIQYEWQQLTPAERTLWQTYAIFLDKKQKKNPTKNINGHQLFININSLRYDLSQYVNLFSPWLLSTPLLIPIPQPINALSVERNGVALYVNLDRAVDQTQEVVICFLSRPLTGSQMSSHTKMILMNEPTNSGTEFQCNVWYGDVYGRTVDVGEWIHVRVALYSTVSENYSNYTNLRTQVI
jgi:hypothetical protein